MGIAEGRGHPLVRLGGKEPVAHPTKPSTASPAAYAGIFVTFEGIDGVGKTTQARRLKRYAESLGRESFLTLEPGGTALGAKIRTLLLSNAQDAARVLPRAEALLYAADRAEHVFEVVRPALERGAVVISDRYIDSSLAYQSGGRELGAEEIRDLSLWATGGLWPERTYLLDMPVGAAQERLVEERHSVPDRLESEPDSFQNRTRKAFRALAEKDRQSGSDRFRVIDASGSEEQVWEQIRQDFDRLVRSHGERGAETTEAGAAGAAGADR